MKISILGLGWLGTPLALALKNIGHDVRGSTRTQEKKEKLTQLGIEAHLLKEEPSSVLMDADVIVLNIPPDPQHLAWFQSWAWDRRTWIIFISSTSQKEVLLAQEAWVKTFSQWSIIRMAGLLGNGRHPGNHLSGRKNLNGGKWPVNLIHQDDAVGLVKAVIEKKVQKKILTGACEEHSSREEFYTEFCVRMGLPVPEFDPNDLSTKPIWNFEEKFYAFKHPKLLGKDL